MENLVPLGTGNSRLMKSNIPASTTLAQLIQMWNNGTFPYDIGPLNSAGISQQGTPLNKATLLKDATAALYGYSDPGPIVPDHLFATLSKAALYYSIATPKYQEVTVNLSTAQEGDIVQLEEDGKLADFYVAKLDYESRLNGAGRTLLVRKDCRDERQWYSSNTNAWARCTMLSWLNGDYKAMLDPAVQEAMATTTYYYTPGDNNWTVTTRSDAVFLLSVTELGKSDNLVNVEGSAIPIASKLEVAYLNGAVVTQWTRSPYKEDDRFSCGLDSSGEVLRSSPTSERGSRPCFTLPSSFSATYYVDSSGNLHDQQEYETAGSTTDVQGNPITIGAQIATGSYVGTGTYGASNPNTLTFEFEPKVWGVYSHVSNNSFVTLYDKNIFPWGINTEEFEIAINTYWTISFDGNKVNWYGTNATYQRNSSGIMYYYFALG